MFSFTHNVRKWSKSSRYSMYSWSTNGSRLRHLPICAFGHTFCTPIDEMRRLNDVTPLVITKLVLSSNSCLPVHKRMAGMLLAFDVSAKHHCKFANSLGYECIFFILFGTFHHPWTNSCKQLLYVGRFSKRVYFYLICGQTCSHASEKFSKFEVTFWGCDASQISSLGCEVCVCRTSAASASLLFCSSTWRIQSRNGDSVAIAQELKIGQYLLSNRNVADMEMRSKRWHVHRKRWVDYLRRHGFFLCSKADLCFEIKRSQQKIRSVSNCSKQLESEGQLFAHTRMSNIPRVTLARVAHPNLLYCVQLFCC